MLQRTIDLQEQLPRFCRPVDGRLPFTGLNAFCPRSGCVIGVLAGKETIRIDIGSSSRPLVETFGKRQEDCCCPYEMDVSTLNLHLKDEALLNTNTPSVPNYKSFQESWRVKPSQNLTKIIERNIKIYDIKWVYYKNIASKKI